MENKSLDNKLSISKKHYYWLLFLTLSVSIPLFILDITNIGIKYEYITKIIKLALIIFICLYFILWFCFKKTALYFKEATKVNNDLLLKTEMRKVFDGCETQVRGVFASSVIFVSAPCPALAKKFLALLKQSKSEKNCFVNNAIFTTKFAQSITNLNDHEVMRFFYLTHHNINNFITNKSLESDVIIKDTRIQDTNIQDTCVKLFYSADFKEIIKIQLHPLFLEVIKEYEKTFAVEELNPESEVVLFDKNSEKYTLPLADLIKQRFLR